MANLDVLGSVAVLLLLCAHLLKEWDIIGLHGWYFDVSPQQLVPTRNWSDGNAIVHYRCLWKWCAQPVGLGWHALVRVAFQMPSLSLMRQAL